jgi:hypothetical protein
VSYLPVPVATDSVDLSVVAHVSVRVSTLPTGESVRGKARVHECNVRFAVGVVEVLEVIQKLVRGEHTLVLFQVNSKLGPSKNSLA